jgi:putative phage-type endonuclease
MHLIEELCDITSMWDKTHDEWLSARGIGGSSIGAACGLNPYQSAFSLWAEMTGIQPGFEGNDATELGTMLEPIVAQLFAQKTGLAVVSWPVALRSKQHPHMTANLDGLIVEPSKDFPAGEVTRYEHEEPPPNPLGIAEFKTGALASPGKPLDWFVGGESVPETYQLQGMWYLALTGLPWVKYGALIGGYGMLTRHLDRDDELIANLIDIGYDFWDCVQKGTPPDVDGTESTQEALKALYPRHSDGKMYEGGDALLWAWEELEQAKAAAADAEYTRKQARARLARMLGDAEVGTVDGVPLVTFRTSRDGVRTIRRAA